MEFYNPQNPKKPRTITGRTTQPWETQNTGKVGNLTTEQLADPMHGFGTTFQAAAKQGSVDALQKAMSGANPEDYAAMDQTRDYLSNYLSDLPTAERGRASTFDSQAQRGLSSLLSQYKAANAGTGRIGGRQYAGAQGDIMSRSNQDYLTGMQNVRQQSLADALNVGQGFSNIQGQDLKERGFQQQQAQGLSDLLMRQMGYDLSREGSMPQAEENNWMADVMPVVGAGVGAFTPIGPVGGMAVGSAMGGAMKGGSSQGNQSGSNLVQLLQNQQYLNQMKQQQPAAGSGYTVTGGNAPWWGS
jgi:hypothetical protein